MEHGLVHVRDGRITVLICPAPHLVATSAGGALVIFVYTALGVMPSGTC